jgi:ADP-ribose pyrophosphatase YjhB (NUDIX family)
MVGKINAFGGKFKPEIDESIKHCAARETFEECGLRPSIESLSRTGIIRFENPTSPVEVHFFFATRWEGELLTESDEMAEIGWHPLSAPPYDQMMSADRKFRLIGRLYEALKQGKVLTATITHDKNMEVIRHSDFLLVHGPL